MLLLHVLRIDIIWWAVKLGVFTYYSWNLEVYHLYLNLFLLCVFFCCLGSSKKLGERVNDCLRIPSVSLLKHCICATSDQSSAEFYQISKSLVLFLSLYTKLLQSLLLFLFLLLLPAPEYLYWTQIIQVNLGWYSTSQANLVLKVVVISHWSTWKRYSLNWSVLKRVVFLC